MKKNRDLVWLLTAVALVALAVAYTPYEVAIPRTSLPTEATPSPTPETFSFYCSGSRHAKAYTGFTDLKSDFPPYHAESGLLEHP